jgi:hypothetical protein
MDRRGEAGDRNPLPEAQPSRADQADHGRQQQRATHPGDREPDVGAHPSVAGSSHDLERNEKRERTQPDEQTTAKCPPPDRTHLGREYERAEHPAGRGDQTQLDRGEVFDDLQA